MTIAVDTNVLVRYLTLDDAEQTKAATEVLEGDSELLISTPVLCELVWVLKRSFDYSTAEIGQALRAITAPNRINVDRIALRAGLDMLEQGGDFADGCILADARRSGCEALVTFDRSLAKLGGAAVRLLS